MELFCVSFSNDFVLINLYFELFSKANSVPLWSFIEWITQIISCFDFENRCYLDDLLLRLAKAYPSAVIYTFQMEYTLFCERTPNAAKRDIVQQIEATLRNPVTEKFIESLKYVSLADKVLDYHIKNIIEATSESDYKRELDVCFENIFNDKNMRGEASVNQVKQLFGRDLMAIKEMNCG